jgi:dihydrolipoamide dehydrogenase
MSKKQLIVLGAGPGGYAAAFLAADLGMDVTLIDKELNPGGVCLYRGCIPSKALLHIAKLVNEAKEASKWGVEFAEPKLYPEKINEWKNKVVKNLTGGLGQLTKQRKVHYIQGTAKFLDSHTLEVEKEGGEKEKLSYENIIIATGSSPARIPSFPDYSDKIWDSTGALDIKRIPKKLLVIGGGYIGLELGTVYASVGSEVTVVEMLPHLLNGADRDLVAVLQKRISKLFKEILVGTKVAGISETKTGVKVTLETSDKKKVEKEFDAVLISTGRKPNTKGFDLEKTGVKINDKGFIVTDKQCKTNVAGIYAIGDVAGEPMLAHKASHEGRAAIEVIAGHKVEFAPNAIPAVVFTDPEIAWCGYTETETKESGIKYEVAKFPWAASGRAMTLDRTDGLTKIIIEQSSQRILGMGIVGAGAGELISEGALAIEMGANMTDLKLTIHPHPTLSETLMETAEIFFGQSTHIYRPKKSEKADEKSDTKK